MGTWTTSQKPWTCCCSTQTSDRPSGKAPSSCRPSLSARTTRLCPSPATGSQEGARRPGVGCPAPGLSWPAPPSVSLVRSPCLPGRACPLPDGLCCPSEGGRVEQTSRASGARPVHLGLSVPHLTGLGALGHGLFISCSVQFGEEPGGDGPPCTVPAARAGPASLGLPSDPRPLPAPTRVRVAAQHSAPAPPHTPRASPPPFLSPEVTFGAKRRGSSWGTGKPACHREARSPPGSRLQAQQVLSGPVTADSSAWCPVRAGGRGG